jgi:hypothetical protein
MVVPNCMWRFSQPIMTELGLIPMPKKNILNAA